MSYLPWVELERRVLWRKKNPGALPPSPVPVSLQNGAFADTGGITGAKGHGDAGGDVTFSLVPPEPIVALEPMPSVLVLYTHRLIPRLQNFLLQYYAK